MLYNREERIPVVSVLRQVVSTTNNSRSLESQSQYKTVLVFTSDAMLLVLTIQSLPINYDKSIPIIVDPNSKNICYIWGFWRLKL